LVSVNVVVDSSSIEVNRRGKHVKSDPVDARELLHLLCRYYGGERDVWSVVNAPAVADEDRRQLHRGLKNLQRQQTECSNRIKGLLASQGLDAAVDADFGTRLAELRDWAGQPVPAGLQQRILQEYGLWKALHREVRDAANEQERRLREGQEPYLDKVRRLMGLKAVAGAWDRIWFHTDRRSSGRHVRTPRHADRPQARQPAWRGTVPVHSTVDFSRRHSPRHWVEGRAAAGKVDGGRRVRTA
jgi:hypothetical protein